MVVLNVVSEECELVLDVQECFVHRCALEPRVVTNVRGQVAAALPAE